MKTPLAWIILAPLGVGPLNLEFLMLITALHGDCVATLCHYDRA
jgi:hypothetical protein